MNHTAFYQKYNLKNKTRAKKHLSDLLQTLPQHTELNDEILFDMLKLHPYYIHMEPVYFFISPCSKYNTYHYC